MGVLHGRDLYNPKWINAEIDDSSGRRFVVPIKFTVGDYFLTEFDDQLYCFEIDHTAIKTYRGTGLRSIRFLNYDTTHFRPITEKVKELELVLKKNDLPRVNNVLANVFKVLSKREKNPFTPHSLLELIKELDSHKDEYGEQVRNIVEYLNELKVEEIITPLKGISNFIEDDLKTTRPNFIGSIVSHYQRLDMEHKKVTNTPIGPKTAWMKVVMLLMLVGIIGFIIYFLWSEGYLDSVSNIGGTFEQFELPSFPSGGPSTPDILNQYSPEELRAAIDRGEIDYDSLPPEVQDMVDNVELPTVTPKE